MSPEDTNFEMQYAFGNVGTEFLNMTWTGFIFQEVKVDGSLEQKN
jgi:hypothetical protein